jgi:hypothetical protein
MLMRTFETMAGISEQQGTGRHQSAPPAGTVLETAGGHNPNRKVGVALFERAILRAGGTNHVGYLPTVSLGEGT